MRTEVRLRIDEFLASAGSTKPPTPEESAKFGLYLPADVILPLFDIWQASNFNSLAVFGLSYVDLPPYVAADLRALLHRQTQLKARERPR